MTSHAPKALLFDLGGVLIEVDFSRALNAWSPLSALPPNELRSAFRFDHAYERHERGEVTAFEYFSNLKSALQLTATLDQIEQGWNAIFAGEIAQTRLLVETIRQTLPCFAFTNTNASHFRHSSGLYPKVVSAFDRIFASHEIGLRKPERAAFDYICQQLELAPASILFFDDLAENVRAAQDAGLRAVHVRGPDDVAEALRAFV